MYIIGDIGNTEVKICFIDNNFIIKKKINIKTNEINKSKIKNNFKFFLKNKKKIKNIIFSSVVPSVYKQFASFFKSSLQIKIVEIKKLKLKKLIDIRVNRKQVGSDRLANSIAAIDKKNNYIIIDFGTATTFDVLIGKNYKGGIISPGINLSLKTLSNKASLIPKINLKRMSKVIGKDTKSAVRSGFFWGYAGLIDNVINLIKKETKKSFDVVITGGFSKLFKNSIKTKTKQDFDITINGLIKATKLIK